jgi:hypothetical protein
MQYYHLIRMLVLLTLAALSLAACAPSPSSQWQDATIKQGAQVQTEYFGPSSWDIN